MFGFILVNSISVYITSKLLDGVELKNFWTAIGVAVGLGLVNFFIKPIVSLLALPLTIITLGLFSLVINALMIMIVDYFIDTFKIKNFGWALGFSLIMSLINALIYFVSGLF